MNIVSWVLASIAVPSIVAIGIWVGKVSERVKGQAKALQTQAESHEKALQEHIRANEKTFEMQEKRLDAFDKTREDVIKILTILEQAKFGEMNERLTKIESVVRTLAKKEGIDF